MMSSQFTERAPADPGTELDLDTRTYSLPWLVFNGTDDQSSGAFVQSVQRIAFREGRARDEEWIADYAATCFEGDALSWYAGVDDETRGSWKRLRLSLLQAFPSSVVNMAPITTGPQEDTTTITSLSKSINTRCQPEHLGRIEVLGDYAAALGFLSFDPAAGALITTDRDKALGIFLPVRQSTETGPIYMGPLSGRNAYPCFGIALLPSKLGSRNAIPQKLPGIEIWNGIYKGFPIPSIKCKDSDTKPTKQEPVDLARWGFAACGESREAAPYRRRSDTQTPGQRGVASAWRYNKQTEELTLHVLTDQGGDEDEVGAYVHVGTSDQLHLHRTYDMQWANLYGSITEDRVRFVFNPNA